MSKKRPSSPSKRSGPSPGTPRAPQRVARPRAGWLRLPRPDPLTLAVVALALLMRLWGVGDRLPDPQLGINVLDDTVVEETDRTTVGRAWNMWRGGTKEWDLNPHTGGWPGLSFYLTLGLQIAYKGIYLAGHPGATPATFARHILEHSDQMFLFARLACILIGCWTVWLTLALGRRLAGRAAGLIAGLFLALNPLHVMTSQHIADPNLLALLFVLLAALAMTRVAEGGGVWHSLFAGAMIGLAGACKYVPLILVLPLAVAHGRAFLRRTGFWASLLAVAFALIAGSPYTFLDWKMTVQDITVQRSALFSDWVGQTAFPISLPTYLAVSLPHAMGWPAYLLSLFGMIWLWRRGRAGQAVALIPALMILANGMLKAAQERYMLIGIPILFIGTALTILSAWEWMWARAGARRVATAVLGLASLVSLAWPLPEYAGTRRSLSLPDTRHLARRWINDHISWDRPMAVELYGPVFTLDDRAMLMWPFFATRTQLVRPAYHSEFLDGLDYYILSREVARRFDADSVHYPVESAYYRWIRANAPVVWRSDSASTSGPTIEVRRMPRGFSTRAQRDSLFASAMPRPTGLNRLGLWCLDLASVFARLGQYERTEEWALRGTQVGAARMQPRLFATLAFARLNLEDFKGAEVAAYEGIVRAPREHTLRFYHATALHELGFKEDALKQFQAAYELSRDPRVLIHIGAGLSELGRHEEAIQVLEQVPPEHPDRAIARKEMARILINKMKRPEEGVAALREAAALTHDPEQADVLRDEVQRLEKLLQAASHTAGRRLGP